MVDYVSKGLEIGKFVTNVVSDMSTATSTSKSNRYRASLAEENARRADILHAERSERLRKEGFLDAGLFQMKAEMSGLSGASLDMWVGQRYHDAYKDVVNARTTREQTVSRFLKEANWHQKNADASEVNKWWGIRATGLTTAVEMYKASKT